MITSGRLPASVSSEVTRLRRYGAPRRNAPQYRSPDGGGAILPHACRRPSGPRITARGPAWTCWAGEELRLIFHPIAAPPVITTATRRPLMTRVSLRSPEAPRRARRTFRGGETGLRRTGRGGRPTAPWDGWAARRPTERGG